MNAMPAAARFLAFIGWYVFPCRGKAPLTKHGLHDATRDRAAIDLFWERWPGANIGVDCGRSGLFVVDVDPEGVVAWADLCARNGGHDTTVTARTPSDGLHVYFTAENARSTVGKIATGIDTRGRGGYVIVPPSVGYEWVNAPAPDWQEPPPLWLARMLRPPPPPDPGEHRGLQPGDRMTRYGERALLGLVDDMLAAPVGQRNDRLNRLSFRAGSLAGAGQIDPDVAIRALLDAAVETGLPLVEAARTVRSGITAGVQYPARIERR